MWQAIFAVLQSIPAVIKLVENFVIEWHQWRLSQIDAKYSIKEQKLKALTEVLKTEGITDDTRKTIARELYFLNRSPD